MISDTYICPDCRGKLDDETKQLRCTSCAKRFPVIDTIPCFYNPDNYYGEIQHDKMNALIDMARAEGYRKAISVFLPDPFVQTYALDESRARWAELLPLNAATRVLDVGCGWGTTTIPIARRAKQVAAIDATLERIKFVDLRAKECNVANVTPTLASAMALPYPDASFDIATFNGVLEWLGAADTKQNPKDLQLLALREARRVLVPGGLVYIGIENRWSLRYFMGSADDHSFIRFTSLLPRWMAQAYFKMRKGGDYFMHTHSLGVYRRMLADSGFTLEHEYHPWPNYRNPVEFIPLNKRDIVAHLDREISRTPRFGRKRLYLLLLKWLTALEGRGRFCHSFLFIYSK